MKRLILPVLALGLATATFAEGVWTQEGTFVFTSPDETFLWRTATNASMRLCVPYPKGATTSDLTVRRGEKVIATAEGLAVDEGQTAAWVDLALPVPARPAEEGVYDLTVTFDAGDPLVASLAVVSGTGAGGEWLKTRCLGTGENKWRKIGDSAVLPVPYGTTSLVLNGESVDAGLDGAAGWYAWGPLSAEAVADGASLTVDGETYGVDAFTYFPGGLLLLFR